MRLWAADRMGDREREGVGLSVRDRAGVPEREPVAVVAPEGDLEAVCLKQEGVAEGCLGVADAVIEVGEPDAVLDSMNSRVSVSGDGVTVAGGAGVRMQDLGDNVAVWVVVSVPLRARVAVALHVWLEVPLGTPPRDLVLLPEAVGIAITDSDREPLADPDTVRLGDTV